MNSRFAHITVCLSLCLQCLCLQRMEAQERSQASLPQSMTDIIPLLDACNVVWDVPGPSSAQSMPVGNGDIGLNVWTEPNGDLDFYIGKTDAWGQDVKGPKGLMKVGGIRVSLSPNPLKAGAPFRQSLDLHDGEIQIQEGNVHLRVWVDANNPVIRVEAQSAQPFSEKVTLNDWRLGKGGDTLLAGRPNTITWYHRNAANADPHVAGLIFGAVILGKGLVSRDDTTLQSGVSSTQLISIYPLTAQVTVNEWKARLSRQSANVEKQGLSPGRIAHRQWWDKFWHRSWVYVQGDSTAADVTRGYVLQRFITACAGRGAYPIKFNGSIFTVDNPSLREGGNRDKPPISVDADFRAWGGQYWFQNTRPMYWPRLMAGDFDEMMPLFDMYAKMLPDNSAQVKKYYNHDGAYFAETAPFWGGLRYWGPEVPEDWTGHYFTPILELSMMMLDYYDYTGDKKFAKETLLPVVTAGLRFYDRHFGRDWRGKLLLSPDNSIEMFWKVCDPAPDIAGLHAILARVLALPESMTDAGRRAEWNRLLGALPDLPVATVNGKEVLLPYTGEQNARPRNGENPELYAVYPFRLYGLGKPDLGLALHTFQARKCRQKGCWVQDPIQAAMLGLTDVAKTYVSFDLTRKDPALKFPAFWVAGNDYAPDEDNGGNGENGLQEMLMQVDGKKILLLPAWPKEWNAEFRLNAPYNTTVEGRVVHGKLTGLVVTPASRRADVLDMSGQPL
jgi:alpha-L-fucosidase 2